jgi:glycerol-3-phosphate dehydrogenase
VLRWNSERRREELQACAATLRDHHHVRLSVSHTEAATTDFDASLPAEPITSPVPT